LPFNAPQFEYHIKGIAHTDRWHRTLVCVVRICNIVIQCN